MSIYLRALIALAAFAVATLAASGQPQAFKLRPTGTDDERVIVNLEHRFWGDFWLDITRYIMDHFTTHVHEEVTHRVWDCEIPAGADVRDTSCTVWDKTPSAVIYGVQWNDNPPFKLDSTREDSCAVNSPIRLPDRQPNCWRILFGDAAKKAEKGEYFRQSGGWALLYRSHFGDLQFLHSMASWNGESMRDTKARIMMWAEFTYLVATGKIPLHLRMSGVQVRGFRGVLGRYWGDVTTLFTYGVPKYSSRIPDVAFGSLLHMVQDSFSKSHVSREHPSGVCGEDSSQPNAGRVLEFHAYGNQSKSKHGEQDSRDLMLAGLREVPAGNVIAVSRHLRKYRESNAPWETVRRYLDECVYAVADEDLDKPAGPGPYK